MSSKDPILGHKIQQLLIKHNLENPINNNIINWQDETYKNKLIQQFGEFLNNLGLDITNPSIAKTPSRVIDFLINESFYGLDYNNFPRISSNENIYKYTTPLYSNNITVHSTCEHHLVSIIGEARVAYIPKNNIVGLSKINRVVDFFAKRPQVQERLTRQILVALQMILDTEDVAVSIQAKHNCIVVRGVKNFNTTNSTFAFGGEFLSNDTLKNTFFQN